MNVEINKRYRIIDKLGSGGMGEVYRATDKVCNDQTIAIKLIREEVVNKTHIARFKKEFEVMTRLKHPNLIHVHDFGFDSENSRYYMTMEYVAGNLLSDAISQRTFTTDHAIEILIELSRALEFIHSRNILHRDIKPANIILGQDGVKVMDFGLADLEGESEKKHKGTLLYMAPEILLKNEVNTKTDVYALGITFYEMICGNKEFCQRQSGSMISVLSDQEKFQTFNRTLLEGIDDPHLSTIVASMTAFDPQKRFGCGAEILDAINKELGKAYSIETEKSKESYVLGAGFVGREQEFSTIKTLLQQDGKNSLLISGEAGIGKSRIMHEMKKFCQLQEITFLEASCNDTIKKLYHPITILLNECLFLCPTQLIDKHGPEIKKLLTFHERLSRIQQAGRTDPKTERRVLSKSITDFFIDLALASRTQMVLYINDIQWIDEASIEIIESLLAKMNRKRFEIGTRLKVYLSSRKEGVACIRSSLERGLTDILELQPFDRQKVESFLHAVFGEREIGTNLYGCVDQITTHAGGNPFFLQEIIRSLVTSDTIIHQSHRWELTIPASSITIPSGINDLLVSRFKRLRLTDTEKRALETLCLIDRQVPYRELNVLSPIDIDSVQKLDYYEVVKKEIIDDELYYAIHHDLIKKIILSEIADIVSLHNTIGLKLEQLHENDREDFILALAHHFYHGKNLSKARFYLDAAIEKASKNYELSTVIDLCDRLISINTDEKKSVSLLLKKMETYRDMSNVPMMSQIAPNLIAAAERSKDIQSRGKCYQYLGEAYCHSHNLIHAIEYLEKALADYKTINDKKLISYALNYIGVYYIYSDNYTKAMEFLKQSLTIAESINEDIMIAYNTGNMGLIQFNTGDFKASLNSHKKALSILMKLNQKHKMPVGLQNIGLTYSKLGDNSLALEYLDKAITMADELESYAFKEIFTIDKIEILFLMGQIAEAEVLNRASLKFFEELQIDKDYIFRSRMLMAQIEHAKNDVIAARQILDGLSREFTDEIYTARIQFELWKITTDPAPRQIALNLYRKLYGDTSKFEYKKFIDDLQVLETHPQTQTQTQADSTPDLSSQKVESDEMCCIFDDLREELDKIQSVFQHTDLGSQVKMNETNKIIKKKLYEIVNQFKAIQPGQNMNEVLEREQKRILFFQQLLEIIHNLNSNLSIDSLLDKILDASIFLMEAERGFIFLENQFGVLEIKAARTKDKGPIADANVKTSHTIIQKALETQQAVFIANVADEMDLSQCQSIIDLELRSVMCAPIGRKYSNLSLERRKYPFLSSSQRLGVMYIDSTNATPQSNFIGTNLVLFQALVDQASIAILNTMLYESVNIDKLTGLYLRSFFEQNLEHELAYSAECKSHVSILMIDIDFFKMVNDRFGHQIGDDVLQTLGGLLKGSLRTSDICGRYGGEEFIIILSNTDLHQAEVVAKKIQNKIAETTFPSGPLTVSMGISCFPDHCPEFIKDETRKKLIKNADQALYRAKANGRNRWELWYDEFVQYQTSRSSAKEILTGNPIRDYRNVEMLLDVIQTVSCNTDRETMLRKIIDLILKSLDADKGMIFIASEVTNVLDILLARDRRGDMDRATLHYSNKIVDMVFKTGKDVCTNTIEDELETQSIIDMELKSIMCVALNHHDKRIGIIYIDSKRVINEFTATELSFINAISVQISLLMRQTQAAEA
ncbi:MAG: diguanylate cyclase [Chitinivibrionales bacterium]|nr:diguanylate cyclase [Chitinivibrionales bacterium]